jgi:hypothetical protein
VRLRVRLGFGEKRIRYSRIWTIAVQVNPLTKVEQLGRLNLLTPQRVKASAQEILTGEMVRLEYVRRKIGDI